MPSVLIVDDSEVDRRLAAGLLAKSGRYEVQFANDGSEALNMLRKSQPSLVLTDLHMPDRGGLMVIEACRLHHENLPVVLMTGQGSEDLAVEALKAGAASYVPKSALSERLVDTLDEVLNHAQQDESSRRLIERLVESSFQFELENDLDLVAPLVSRVEEITRGLRVCDTVECIRFGVAVGEALRAAMYRGNLELPAESLLSAEDPTSEETTFIARRRHELPFRDRRVLVDLQFDPSGAQVTIQHQGTAFWRDQEAYATPGDHSLEDPLQRGAVLMHAFSDAVEFSKDGTRVTLYKRKHAREFTNSALANRDQN